MCTQSASILNIIPSLQLTSQHPYAEVYIGQPHVWTVDIENGAEVEKAIRSILSQKVTLKRTDVLYIKLTKSDPSQVFQ